MLDCEYVAGGSMHVAQVHVIVQGDKSCGKAFVTFHDIGMNRKNLVYPNSNSYGTQMFIQYSYERSALPSPMRKKLIMFH